MEKSPHHTLLNICLIIFIIFSIDQSNAEIPNLKGKSLNEQKSVIRQLTPTPNGINGYSDGFGSNILMVENIAFISAINAMTNGVVFVFQFDGESWDEIAHILPPNDVYEPLFGSAMSYANNQLAIGAPGQEDNNRTIGAVYIFEHINDSWVMSQKLNASDSSIGDRFGTSISLTDNHLLIGAPSKVNKTGTTGAVYAFTNNENLWTESQKITLDSSLGFYEFGKALASFENKLIVIANNSNSMNQKGVVNVFEFENTWNIIQQFVPLTSTSSHFGSDILMNQNMVIIGDYYQFNEAENVRSGAVFSSIYDSINHVWLEPEIIYHDSPEWGDRFGTSLSLYNNLLVVGASGKDLDIDEAGVVYVFERFNSEWVQTHKIIDDNSPEYNRMGGSVAILGDMILTNTKGDNIGQYYSPLGSITPFRIDNSTITRLQPFTPLEASKNDRFGSKLSIDNTHLIIGAYNDTTENGFNKGTVYTYKYVNNEWQLSQKLIPNDPELTDTFGRTLAHDKNTLMVGSAFSSSFVSSVYIFEHIDDLWTQVQKIENPAGQSLFGWSISIDGNRALIAGGINKVYVYEKVNGSWIHTDQLVLPASIGTILHIDSDLSENLAVIGVKYYINVFNPESVILIYEKNSGVWSLKQTISPTNQNERFMVSPIIWGSKIIFGANDLNALINTGYIYIYDYDGSEWVLEDTITPLNGADGDDFGSSIQYNNNQLIIGATGDDEIAEDSGAVYIFQKSFDNVWSEIKKIKAPDAALNDYFGKVKMNQLGVIAIGASSDDAAGTDSGSVYLTEKNDLIFIDGFGQLP